ncbi:kunitz-type serine protease inhibitor DrTI-like [Prosopis cineraria]|uniref:kunitz-type serine protease inhibitor DrTI-like n=1 Tax=Prosopis cineraria TaxID=364024 RepID=UPI00240EA4E8|nr:kunitz-type serine protease inhibitor DrTI-like [Prosopis cineraria]
MPARSLIIALSFLLWFSFTTFNPLSLASASSEEEPVNDVNGEPIVPGQEYYIMSAVWGADAGGGVKPGRAGDASSCAYSVLQESSEKNKGAAVKFHVQGTSKDKIYPGSTALAIEFVEKPDCAESSKWVVAYDGSGSSSSRLVIGGAEDHPDSELVSGVFRIEVFNAIAYKLVFCSKSNVFSSSSGACYDVGVDYKAEGSRNLVVEKQSSGNVFMVAFVKADSDKGKFSII